jgi:hypothetical protein
VTVKKDWSVEDLIRAPNVPQTLPAVLGRQGMVHFLGCVANLKHRTILTTCYAAGLRSPKPFDLPADAQETTRDLWDVPLRRMCRRWTAGMGRYLDKPPRTSAGEG